MEEAEIYLLKEDDVMKILKTVELCCKRKVKLTATLVDPITWAARLTIAEAAEILDRGIDVKKFIPAEHDFYGIIQNILFKEDGNVY